MIDEAPASVRCQFAFAVLLVVAGALLAALTPLALKALIDAASTKNGHVVGASSSTHAALAACYVAALCGSRMLTELRGWVAGTAEQQLCAALSRSFFAQLLALPLAFHVRRRTGSVVHSLYQATAGCQIIASTIVTAMVPVLVEVATVTGILLQLKLPMLVCLFVLTMLAYLVVFRLAVQPSMVRARELSAANLELHAALNDNLVNVEAIKSFGAEAATQGRFDRLTAELEAHWSRFHRQRAYVGLATATILAVSISASLAVSLQAVSSGTLTIGGFVMANVYMLQIVRPLEMIGSATREFSKAVEFVRPFLDLVCGSEDPPGRRLLRGRRRCARGAAATNPPAKARDTSRAPAVTFEGVRFAYRASHPALDCLDLHVPPGHAIAIVGASGSGKSTIVRLLLRLYRPQAGRVLLNRTPIDSLAADELRSIIGLVPQDTVLFNDTIEFNIALGSPGASHGEVEQAARTARLHDFVTSLPAGYATLVGERGLMLSGGERQRLAIARAVLKRPLIYVFDEATSMLDSETEALLLRDLRKVSAGCTTITIAHRLSTVQHADEIVVLAHGRIVERGHHAALMARGGEYARLWRAQSECVPT